MKFIFGISLAAPRLVVIALSKFENISLVASSSSSPITTLPVGSSSPSIKSFIAVSKSGEATIFILPFISPLRAILAIIAGVLMPFCVGASYSAGSDICGVAPVNPSIVALNSFLKISKNLVIVIILFFVIFVAIFFRLIICH